jgi:hypothetical protein
METVHETAAVLQAIAVLFDALNIEGIRYCQWKSTDGLLKALLGKTDFDLLVDRADIQRFRVLIQRHGFKPLVSHPSRQYPAIEDFLGFDADTGRLIHLHVHFRVVLGQEYVKNYYPPLERGLLTTERVEHGVRVPEPELEAAVLALRALLKYRPRDALCDGMRVGPSACIPRATRAELARLIARTTPERLADALARHADFLSPGLVDELVETLAHSPRDATNLWRLRARLRRDLAPYRLRGETVAGLRNLWTSLGKQWPFRRVRRLLPLGDRHKTPVAGGLTVAFVGADGAGKSTVIAQIVKWLSWRLVVHTCYMGSSRPSAGTRVWKYAGDAVQLAAAVSRRLLGPRSVPARLAARAELLCDHLRYLGDARDRLRRFEESRRAAARGAVVVYDRYPLVRVEVDGRRLDGPRIRASCHMPISRLSAWLAAAEERAYRRIQPPDHVFVLHVSPAVSQARKPGHPAERIEAKSRALRSIVPNGFGLTEVDADRPLDDVLLSVKRALWEML